MPRFLVYIDAVDIHAIGDALDKGVEDRTIEEFYTLTIDGSPVLFERGDVGDPEFCNGLAMRCAGITEE